MGCTTSILFTKQNNNNIDSNIKINDLKEKKYRKASKKFSCKKKHYWKTYNDNKNKKNIDNIVNHDFKNLNNSDNYINFSNLFSNDEIISKTKYKYIHRFPNRFSIKNSVTSNFKVIKTFCYNTLQSKFTLFNKSKSLSNNSKFKSISTVSKLNTKIKNLESNLISTKNKISELSINLIKSRIDNFNNIKFYNQKLSKSNQYRWKAWQAYIKIKYPEYASNPKINLHNDDSITENVKINI